MERPIFITAGALEAVAVLGPGPTRARGALDTLTGAKLLLWAFLAQVVFGLFGSSLGRALGLWPGMPSGVDALFAQALALLLGSVIATAVLFDRLAVHAPSALRDRSQVGCAWYGAPDETVVQAFLIGGSIAFAQVLTMPAVLSGPADDPTLRSAWALTAAMIHAFAVVAAAPVIEELLLRGVLFATLRTRLATLPAAVVVTMVFALLHYPQIVAYPPSLIGTLAVGGATMALRIRHASLAPAIALHCGHNLTVCVALALA